MDLAGLNKYKTKIFNIIIIVLALIIAGNIYKKQTQAVASLKEKKDLEIKKNQILGAISQSEKNINAYKSLLAKKDASSVMNTVSNMTKESGVKVVSFKPLPEQKYPDYLKLPFDLVVSATDYHALGKFISSIENYQDVYIVDTVEIRPETQNGELKIKLKLSSIASVD